MMEYKGFTLLEVIIAMAILAIIIIPFSGIFVQSVNIRAKAGDISRAGYVAQNIIEEVRAGVPSRSARRDGYYVEVHIEDYLKDGKIVGDESKVLKSVDVKVYALNDMERPLARRQSIVAVPR